MLPWRPRSGESAALYQLACAFDGGVRPLTMRRSLLTEPWKMCASRLLCSFVVIALFMPRAFGQSPPPALPDTVKSAAATLRDTAAHDSGAYAIVRSLTVEVGPRSAGSQGDRAAVAW